MITIWKPPYGHVNSQSSQTLDQTNKQIEEISHENSNATSEKCFSQMCSCTRPVRTLEYN